MNKVLELADLLQHFTIERAEGTSYYIYPHSSPHLIGLYDYTDNSLLFYFNPRNIPEFNLVPVNVESMNEVKNLISILKSFDAKLISAVAVVKDVHQGIRQIVNQLDRGWFDADKVVAKLRVYNNMLGSLLQKEEPKPTAQMPESADDLYE